MKILIVIIFMATASFMKIQAQIVLDHDFPNQRVDMVTLEHAGPKYYQYDYAAHTGALLNLDYTVYRTFVFPHIPCTSYNVVLITENLFDTDSTTLEYVMSINDTANSGFRIFREDTTLLFQADSGAILYANEYSAYRSLPYVPIFNTDSGTKMIVAYGTPFYHTSIYNLPGKLPISCCSSTMSTSVVQLYNKQERLSNNPNPFKESTIIEYTLPKDAGSADLYLYNESGMIVNIYKLSNTQNKFELIASELKAGTYYYKIVTSSGDLLGQKLIKVN